jgi:KUP system potassium uptake protein
MAATGISERVSVGPAEHGHAVPTSFWALTLGSIGGVVTLTGIGRIEANAVT